MISKSSTNVRKRVTANEGIDGEIKTASDQGSFFIHKRQSLGFDEVNIMSA